MTNSTASLTTADAVPARMAATAAGTSWGSRLRPWLPRPSP